MVGDKAHMLFVRYIINGLLATAVHFGVLTINLSVLKFESAGLANVVAAVFGITASFLGSRYYVFREYAAKGSPVRQALWFLMLYAGIALLHGALLYAWTDVHGLDYRIGFIVATSMQVAISYMANRVWVFRS